MQISESRIRSGAIVIRPSSRLHKLVVLAAPALAAMTAVAAGATINRIFGQGGAVFWQWAVIAVGFALSQVYLSIWISSQADHARSPRSDRAAIARPAAPSDAPVSSNRARITADWQKLATCARDLAARRLPTETIPLAWTADPADGDGAKLAGSPELRVGQLPELVTQILGGLSRRTVIVGGPGSGKTVLAWRIVNEMLSREDSLSRVPVVLPVGAWDPFEQDFRDWVTEQVAVLTCEPESALGLSDVLPILDGFDEWSSQLRSRAVELLSQRDLENVHIIVVSRPVGNRNDIWHRYFPSASIIRVRDVPGDQIVQYIENTSGADYRWSGLREIVRQLSMEPDGILSRALSSAFMLDIVTHVYLDRFPDDLITSAQSGCLARVEETLAKHFADIMVAQRRWSVDNSAKWLAAIAERASHYPFVFMPNSPDPAAFSSIFSLLAAVFPALVIIVAVGTSIHWYLVAVLLILQGFSMLILLMVTSDTSRGPALDPRAEIRRERSAALGTAGMAVLCSVVIGMLTLLAPLLRYWVIAIGAILLALAGVVQEGWRARKRVIGAAAGLTCGAFLAFAAVVGSTNSYGYRFVLAGGIAAAPIFLFTLAGNFVSHVLDGEGLQGIAVAPVVAIFIAVPAAFLSASVIAVTVLARPWFSSAFLGELAGMAAFAMALGAGFALSSRWAQIGNDRFYFALTGVFPLRLLDFLEDMTEARLLRRVGYSYEFKHEAIRRVYLAQLVRD